MAKLRVVGRRPQGACPYCREEVTPADRVRCPSCLTLTHRACHDELGGCPTLGCREAAPRRARRPPGAPPGQVAGPTRAAQGAADAAWDGPLERRVPGPLARLGPYGRLALGLLLHGTVSVVAPVASLLLAVALAAKWKGSVGELLGVISVEVALGLGFAVFSAARLRALVRAAQRVGPLLDDGLVTPMRFSTSTVGRGKHSQTWVSLEPLERGRGRAIRVRIGGLLPPWWLWVRFDQTVFVHGAQGDGPWLVEFEEGLLALLEP